MADTVEENMSSDELWMIEVKRSLHTSLVILRIIWLKVTTKWLCQQSSTHTPNVEHYGELAHWKCKKFAVRQLTWIINTLYRWTSAIVALTTCNLNTSTMECRRLKSKLLKLSCYDFCKCQECSFSVGICIWVDVHKKIRVIPLGRRGRTLFCILLANKWCYGASSYAIHDSG